MGWRVRGVRGATTVDANTPEAVQVAVLEMLTAIADRNNIDPENIVSVTFSVTTDINSVFPAKIARSLPQWEHVPLLDVQHMHVEGDLKRCIRVLMHINTELEQGQIQHIYLKDASHLRPDLTSLRSC
ncbi:chorismate mutase [Thalassoporum mexicanum PCC 7367]|uniref:chorismate mutase n=1 Tax=Thalassoporum mexicanum TaxID=3457544 RepID=UPI00029FE5BB|nr:chorismate mutase [Pseudanabaena sp. PCC 7367]AFY70892.1 chorismate mutase [Pseudanabaena sp. PCC 7367]